MMGALVNNVNHVHVHVLQVFLWYMKSPWVGGDGGHCEL